MRIQDLPVDVWVIVMKHVQNQKLLETFDTLFLSRAINIPAKYKLDTFWIVVSQRHMEQIEEKTMFPDVDMFKDTFQKLREMGVSFDKASHAVRIANGKLDDAVHYLWNI